MAEIPSELDPSQEPDVWVRRLSELVRLAVVLSPALVALTLTIKAGFCN